VGTHGLENEPRAPPLLGTRCAPRAWGYARRRGLLCLAGGVL